MLGEEIACCLVECKPKNEWTDALGAPPGQTLIAIKLHEDGFLLRNRHAPKFLSGAGVAGVFSPTTFLACEKF
jgi:hypothetical protein